MPLFCQESVPLIDFGAIGIVRCHVCRAYVNPFMQWGKGGQSFICNLCGRANDTPAGYFSPLDPQTGRRADYPSRPELSSGVVDLVAPGEYMVRPPMPPSYIFVLDVSYYNVHSGGLQYITHAIKHVLQLATEGHEAVPLSDPRTKVAIITYDSSIHFYNLKAGLSQPQMLSVSDLTEAFVPQGLDLLVNLHDSKHVIDTLLTRLPLMFAQTQNVQACLGPAAKAAMTVARHLGGKLLLFTAQLPSLGVGKLAARFDVKSLAPESLTLSGSDREAQLFKPQSEFYKNLALECSKLQIGVDLFLLTPQYQDVTTLAPLAHLTGGQLYYYPEFQLPRDGNQLIEDLRHNLIRTTGWEGVMRVRCSKGVKVQAYHGAFFLRSSDLLALPSVDCDKAFGVQLTLQENLSTSHNFIQAALLYTTSTSERRIRVLNMCLPTTGQLQDLFNTADGEAVLALLAKMAIDRAMQAKLSDAREALVNKLVEILASYRQTLGPGQAGAQLLLPATLTSLPLHVLALIKHPVLRSYQDINPDLRAYHMQRFRSLSSSRTLLAIYPHLYALHTLADEATPPVLTLSSEKLDRQGAFLLDNGEVLLLWVGKAISIEFLQHVFGQSSLDGVDPATVRELTLDTCHAATDTRRFKSTRRHLSARAWRS
jgi:protein transport protein SEC24